ncbi:MAG TPA: hypothetical protein VJI97_04920 [Candidatus Nanoarchaeia archaeon]|nr:hypothetical protein [Candidatus Nanoarchaeia archaeon]
MKKAILIVVLFLLVLPIAFTAPTKQCTDSTNCIDNCTRTDNADIGISSNGKVWNEGTEDQDPSPYYLTEIASNRCVARAESGQSVSNNRNNATLIFTSAQNITTDGSYIELESEFVGNNRGAGIFQLLSSGRIVYSWFFSGETGGTDCHYNGTDMDGSCLYTTTFNGNSENRLFRAYLNFTNRTVTMVFNDTITSNVSFNTRFLMPSGLSVTYIDGIKIGNEVADSDATIVHKIHYIGFFQNFEPQPDTTPPSITAYSLYGCANWNTDKTNACNSPDTAPIVEFNTSKIAWCAITGNYSSTLGMNYSDMGSRYNCTGGEGTYEHMCTLVDELVYENAYLYISCKDDANRQNRTSTSGALKVFIAGLDTTASDAIGLGIQNSLLSGYANYTNQQIYARNLADLQVKGTYDKVAKKGNNTWAINWIGPSESFIGMFNLTPVLYALEFSNLTATNMTKQVELLVNATR